MPPPLPVPASLLAALGDLPAAPLWVGLSGGLDSSVLLHALAHHAPARAIGLRAVHVHHGLHADADAWAGHCAQLCTKLCIELTVVRARVVRDGGKGLEAAARDARHAAFAATLADGDVLALGHHRDDQAETFLLRALRGSGPGGLGSMRRWSPLGGVRRWRPWLDIPRADLLAYAQATGLAWLEDPSNADTAFDRNFLRERVLPLLRERWPQADGAFTRSAGLLADAEGLLGDGDALALSGAATADPSCVSVAELQRLPSARRARVLRRWIADLRLPPLPAVGIERIEVDLLPARPDAVARFVWQGAVVTRWRDLLHAGSAAPPWPADWRAHWDGAARLSLPVGGTLSLSGAERFDQPLRVHARVGGERIALPGRTHTHLLKHVLQQRGVPPWQRERLPLLSDASGSLLAAGDLVYSAAFDRWLRERGATLDWASSCDRLQTRSD